MSENTILIVAGVLIFLVGLAKFGSQTGGFNLKNVGINIFGTSTQINRVGNVAPEAASSKKPNWTGLAIAALGSSPLSLGCSRRAER